MKKKWHSILPWIALLSGTLVIVLLTLSIVFNPRQINYNNKNREFALEKLKSISIENKEMITKKSFSESVNKTLNNEVINTIWIVSEKGEIVFTKGEMAASTPLNKPLDELIDKQSKGLINAIEESIDSVQKQALKVAAAIRREGEHNDVYGHLVLPLKTPQNELTSFIGVAYLLNSSKPPLQVYLLSISIFICFMVYWLSLPIWVYLDSRSRNDKSLLWTIFILIGNLPAYIAYLLSRK